MDVDRKLSNSLYVLATSLQWSHVLMDVDRSGHLHQVERLIHVASMEPRPDGRG